MSDLTETDIVAAVRQGRREGQTEMVARYAQRVFAMIARQVPDVMDAQAGHPVAVLRQFAGPHRILDKQYAPLCPAVVSLPLQPDAEEEIN